MLMACAERILAAAALICCANKGAAAVIRCTYIGGGYNMEEEDEERKFIEHGSVVLLSTMWMSMDCAENNDASLCDGDGASSVLRKNQRDKPTTKILSSEKELRAFWERAQIQKIRYILFKPFFSTKLAFSMK